MIDGGRTDGKWKIEQCSVGPETAINHFPIVYSGDLDYIKRHQKNINKVRKEDVQFHITQISLFLWW